MEKLKKKRGAKRSRFTLVANTLRRMLGENNKQNITSMFLKSLKKNLDDLQRLDRAIQELLPVEDVKADRVKSEIYLSMYEQLCAEYRKCAKKRDSKLRNDKSASEKFQVLSELRPDTTHERILPPNVCHQPAGDISESSADSSREPTLPSSGNVLSPANEAKSWDQLVNQIAVLENSLPPELVGDTPDTPDTRGTQRHTIRWYLRTISLTRLLVALVDDVSPERLPARDWRRVQRALAAPPLGADRVYVIKNSFLLQRPLEALWATLHVVRRNDVERCSAARVGEGAAQRMERWRAAHRDYCAGGAAGSLLLLQRRWHEMRLLARAWARAGEDGAGEEARLLDKLCRTFPHVVQEEPQRWQELRRAGELDLDPYDSYNSEYSDEEEGNLVIDEGPTEARTGVDARVGARGDSLLDEGDDVIDKLQQIDPAQIKTTLIFDSDTEMDDVKDVDTSPGSAALGYRVGELQERNSSHALKPATRTRDRLVFEEDDEVGGNSACVGGGAMNSEVKSEPGAVTSESEAGSEGAVGAAPTRGAVDSKLTMEARVLLVRVDELPTWRERARGDTPRPAGPRGGQGSRGVATNASSSRGEESPKGKYAGNSEQLLSLCRPVSVLLERLPLDVAGSAEGECGVGCRCVGANAGGKRCGRVVLPHLAQVLAQRRCLLTAQVAPLVRDHGTTPAPGGESGEHAVDRSSETWHALDLDAEKSYEPEEMLVRTRSPAVREAQWVRPRGVALLRRLHSQLLACLQRHRLLTGDGVTRVGQTGAGPLTPGENFEDTVKIKGSKKRDTPPLIRGQDPADPPGRGKRTKKTKLKVKPAPEANDPPEDGRNEYERWMEERNRGSLMYGFKPREVKTRQSTELTEPARKKTLLNSHDTVAAATDMAVEGGGGGKAVEGDDGGNKRGYLRVVPLASLQGPSLGAGGREEAQNEAVVDLCDDSGDESTMSARSLEGSLIPSSRLVVQPIVSHYNVFLESIAPNDQSSVAQIPLGQIFVPQNPVPQSSTPQNLVSQSSISQNPVPQSTIPQNPVSQSSVPQNPLPQNSMSQSSMPQNPVPQSRVPQNPVPQTSMPQNPVPQSHVPQNPVPQSSIPQNPVPQSSVPQNPVPQSSMPQNLVPHSSMPQYPVPQSSMFQSSMPQNPVPQSSVSQNPVPQSSKPQNPVPHSSIPQNPIPHNPVPQSSMAQNPVPQSSVSQNPVPQSSVPQNPLPQNSMSQSSMPQNPIPQSRVPHNPVPQSSISQNPLPQSSIAQNAVLSSTIPQKPVLSSTMPQNTVLPSTLSQKPVLPSTMPQNSGLQSSIPQNFVSQIFIPQNPVPQSSIPQNFVPQNAVLTSTSQKLVLSSAIPQKTVLSSTMPQKTVLPSTMPQNPVPSLIPQNRVIQSVLPQSRVSQTRKVVKILLPGGVLQPVPAPPPTSQCHRDRAPPQALVAIASKVQAPINPARIYSLVPRGAHSSTNQNAINQTYTSQGHLGHIRVYQVPVARHRKVDGPPQYRYYRPPQETRLSTPTTTTMVTGNSTPFDSEPLVVGTAPPSAQAPWARSGEPTPAAPQPPWAQSGEPTPAAPQPSRAQSGESTPAAPQPPWLRSRAAGPADAQRGGPEAGVLPLTERNLALHNRIFSNSSNTRLK